MSEAREIIAGALKTPYYSRKPHATPEEIALERADDVLDALREAGFGVSPPKTPSKDLPPGTTVEHLTGHRVVLARRKTPDEVIVGFPFHPGWWNTDGTGLSDVNLDAEWRVVSPAGEAGAPTDPMVFGAKFGVDIERLTSKYPTQPREATTPARSAPDPTTEETER